ncbi:contactin-associated protein-like 5 [Manis pentadactyla]|uniref:contactin-associated protein-like 5 n=1 Tax=Manis pentadactyla TaxID=143292 RepID=UPI00255CC850|nr:contactin-associated protein-like 5 [Manis pentadactyla]
MFQEPYPVTKNASLPSSVMYADAALSKENIAVSIVTAQVPSLLLYISSSQDALAVLLCDNGECRQQEAQAFQEKENAPASHVTRLGSRLCPLGSDALGRTRLGERYEH